jgi:hypothetical protein
MNTYGGTSMTHALNTFDHVVVGRTRNDGHDRAYVWVAGDWVGYRDVASGSVHCADARNVGVVIENTEELVSGTPTFPARSGRYRKLRPPSLRPARQRESVRPPLAVLLPDRDLALRAPQAPDVPIGRRPATHDPVAVARRLLALPAGWRVLHAVPVGEQGTDVDHLVIGPGGVFTVNAMHHRDAKVRVHGNTVILNGHSEQYVDTSRREAQRAARLLTAKAGTEVPVRGVVAVAGAHGGFTVEAQPPDKAVVVVLLKSLATFLRSLPVVLDAGEVARLHEIARHLATWRPATVEWTEFRTCPAPVRRAARRATPRPGGHRVQRTQLVELGR